MLGTTAFRIAAMAVAAFVLVSAAIAATLVWQTNRIVTAQVLDELRHEAQLLRKTEASGGAKALREAVELRSTPPARGLYRLSDASGHKIAGNLSRFPPEIDPRVGGVFRYAAEGSSAAAPLRLAAAVAEEIDGALLIVGRDVEDQRAFADRIRAIFLWGFALLAIATLAGGLAAARMVLRRIEGIAATSRSIMAGDLSRRMTLSGNGDEFDDLSESLNAMLERIEQLMASLREVSDNIAHDLKTPLNRLRNKAEAALRDSRGTVAYREGLERTIEEADALISTFNALLLIARLEAGAVDETATEFDVALLVRDAAELYEPVAEEAGIALECHAEPPLMMTANRQLITQAVANLIDNAIKYGQRADARTGDPHRVLVRVEEQNGQVLICVADNGPGIGEKDRERVLKRFVRLEESRTRPGTGLGLSLVAAVARLHGGTIRLEDNRPGLRAVLVLPYRRPGAAQGATVRG
jgi:signal transduction histidine kinase